MALGQASLDGNMLESTPACIFNASMKTPWIASLLCILTSVTFTHAATPRQIYFNRPADAYGVESPLRAWEHENPKRTHKPNPDKAWERYGLPLGNGFIGAMVYGGVSRERIQFNEHSLWSGGPGSEGWIQNQSQPMAYTNLPAIRKALLEGDTKTAQALSTEALRGMGEDDRDKADLVFGRYQTFGEITIETGHPDPAAYPEAGYSRMLDLSRGVVTVRYQRNGTTYTREMFVSHPDRCLVIHFSAEGPGWQQLELAVASPHAVEGSVVNEDDGVLMLSGKVPNNGLRLDARIGVLTSGGQVEINAGGIRVDETKEVTFLLTAGTDYAPHPPTWRGDPPGGSNARILSAALKRGYPQLLKRHIADHQGLHGRVSLDLGTTAEPIRALPTDERVQQNKQIPDPDLEALYFQFGRYLLMASSRPGGLPANLQGIWCNETIPAWNADYHLNINLQMNYWPAGPCHLLECQVPLIDYTDALRGPGASTARAYNQARGWTSHLSGNIWGYTTPHPGRNRPRFWAWFPLGGAWLTTHVWEHYRFGRNEEFLRERGWPILAGTADFLVDYLYELPNGELSSTPSWSPEHGPISLGTTADLAMAREALQGAMDAADVLGETGPRIDAWRMAHQRLVPYKIGQHGQLQEWYEDIDKPTDKHRHLNHLFGLYPGSQINPVHTPKLAAASRVSLTQRGDGATGWSMGWKINFWARMHDGNHAYTLVRNLLTKGTNPNLFDVHPPFQIDGNFGGCAGIAEMLLQSQADEIHLLPALPSAWPDGSYRGLQARGGITVDLEWQAGQPERIRLVATRDGPVTVRFGERTRKVPLKAGKPIVMEDFR